MSDLVDNHPLGREFPDLKDRIHALKTSDAHFRKLLEEYEEADKSVVRAEQGLDHLSDQVLEEQKMTRVKLKDELFGMLTAG